MIRKLSNNIVSNRGFTLPELLIVIAIVGLLAATVLFAMAGAQENAKADKTRAQIKRINSLIALKWEELETTRVQLPNFGVGNVTSDNGQMTALKLAQYRVDAMRELQRMTLPDRKSDVTVGLYLSPSNGANPNNRYGGLTNAPSVWRTYQRKAQQQIKNHLFDDDADWTSAWSPAWEQSECLYLILSQIVDDDTVALEYFSEDEIGDVDKDGMPEILDAWGMPILFLRWAPGFNVPVSEAYNPIDQFGYSNDTLKIFKTLDVPGSRQNPETEDPFDPLKIYTRYPLVNGPGSSVHRTFNLYPVVISAGPDKKYDIYTGQVVQALPPANFPPNNPFIFTFDYAGDQAAIGTRHDNRDDTNGNGRIDEDDQSDGKDGFSDNIHNHVISTSR